MSVNCFHSVVFRGDREELESLFWDWENKRMSLFPADIQTEPKEHICFNGPFLHEQNAKVRVTNQGAKTIGWEVKSTNPHRFLIEPTCGELKPHEEAVLEIKCAPFVYNAQMSQDRVTLEWVDEPENEDHFSREWFHHARVVRRQIFPIEYNL